MGINPLISLLHLLLIQNIILKSITPKCIFFLHLHDFKFKEIEALFCDLTITVFNAPYFRKYCDIHAI